MRLRLGRRTRWRVRLDPERFDATGEQLVGDDLGSDARVFGEELGNRLVEDLAGAGEGDLWWDPHVAPERRGGRPNGVVDASLDRRCDVHGDTGELMERPVEAVDQTRERERGGCPSEMILERRVPSGPLQVDPEEDRAASSEIEALPVTRHAGRLGDDRRIRPDLIRVRKVETAMDAPGLLICQQEANDRTGLRPACGAEPSERHDHSGDAGLHVAGAETVEPSVGDDTRERIMLPFVDRSDRLRVDVAGKNQGRPRARALDRCDHVRPVGLGRDRVHVADAALSKQAHGDVGNRPLVPRRILTWSANQLPRNVDDLVELATHHANLTRGATAGV